jgi:hypothetical protein
VKTSGSCMRRDRTDAMAPVKTRTLHSGHVLP